MADPKLAWQGTVTGVQPRIRLTRSFDQRYHTYLGYVLNLHGQIDDQDGPFLVGIGKAAQAKHQFKVGDIVSGRSVPVEDSRLETAAYYKTAGLKIIQRAPDAGHTPPPWHGVAPDLEIYQDRGHRRLSARTYAAKCESCIWGCRMAVEMIIDHWNPQQRRYRTETFCYGPKSCRYYQAGPVRTVPGRKGISFQEEDWIDEEATRHRTMNE
jgi:hypothetical protein